MRTHRVAASLLLISALAGPMALAAEPQPVVARPFDQPEMTGRLKGADVSRFRIEGHEGQTVTLALDASSGLVTFRIIEAETGKVVADSPVRFWSGELPADGDYDVEVFLADTAKLTRAASFRMWVTVDGPPMMAGDPGEAAS